MDDLTHLRYDHNARPRELDVACPRCTASCRALKPSERGRPVVVMDMDPTWNKPDWRFGCSECGLSKEGIAYKDLPPLYYQVEVAGVRLWAWNREHLALLAMVLNSESVDGHPYEWFATYAKREWLQGSARAALLRAVRKKLLTS